MKKLLFLILAIAFLAAPNVFADWTITASFDQEQSWTSGSARYQKSFRIKVTGESDGADPAEFNLSTYLPADQLASILGGALYKIHTAPGTDAPANAAVSIGLDGDLGEDWTTVTTSSLDTKAEEFSGGSRIVWDIQIDFPDIGDSGDDILLYFTILK